MSKKLPWEKHPEIWKTEAAFMSYIRGGIRKAIWSRYPVKLQFIKNNRERIPNPNPRGKVKEVWGGRCYITGKLFAQKDLEVDHVKGHFSLRTMNDLQSFMEGLLYLEESDLKFVSKEAHKNKSYAERMGITYEEAAAEKKAISLCKLPMVEQKQILTKHNLPCDNAADRRKSFVTLTKRGDI
jgi:hypothetical protein